MCTLNGMLTVEMERTAWQEGDEMGGVGGEEDGGAKRMIGSDRDGGNVRSDVLKTGGTDDVRTRGRKDLPMVMAMDGGVNEEASGPS
jgi:hypothetical protein